MKKIILILISQAILLSSCSKPFIIRTLDGNEEQIIADLTKGTCVVSKIDAPITEKSNIKLANVMLKKVRLIWRDAFVYINSTDPLHLPSADSLSLYNHDFLLKIRVSGTWEAGGIGFGDANDNYDSNNNLTLAIQLFEIETGRRVYYQVINAYEEYEGVSAVSLNGEDKAGPIYIIKGMDTVIKRAMVKGIRNLQRYVDKQRKQVLAP